jgi:hypothetical protein
MSEVPNEPWTPSLSPDDGRPVNDLEARIQIAIFQALGGASMCWEHIERAGVFNAALAKWIGDGLVGFLKSEGVVPLAPPSATDLRWDEPVCVGFQWIGQSFAHCEGCGRDIAEHIGLDWIRRGSSLLSGQRELIPFDQAMERIPLFAELVTPILGGKLRWEP